MNTQTSPSLRNRIVAAIAQFMIDIACAVLRSEKLAEATSTARKTFFRRPAIGTMNSRIEQEGY